MPSIKFTLQKNACIFFLGCMLSGCGAGKQNKALEGYIQKVTQTSLPEATTIYAMIPDNQCKNCIRYNADELSEKLKEHIVIISSFPKNYFKNFPRVYHDPSSDMLRLKALDYSNKFVIVKNANVMSVLELNDFYKQADSLGSVYFDDL